MNNCAGNVFDHDMNFTLWSIQVKPEEPEIMNTDEIIEEAPEEAKVSPAEPPVRFLKHSSFQIISFDFFISVITVDHAPIDIMSS